MSLDREDCQTHADINPVGKVRIRPNVTYTFDISPEKQYFMAPPKTGGKDRVDTFTRHWTNLLDHMNHGGVQYYCQVEISEPYDGTRKVSGGPRLHLHGVIRFLSPDEIRYFHVYVAPLIFEAATLKIDTISDFDRRWSYMHKMEFLSFPKITNIIHVSDHKSFFRDPPENGTWPPSGVPSQSEENPTQNMNPRSKLLKRKIRVKKSRPKNA